MLFDKVIVVVAQNPSKPEDSNRASLSLPNEVIYHKGLITKLFNNTKHVEFTMVRGIRNEYDIAAEMNYRAWVDDLQEGIPFVHLFCDPQFEKLSSSAIREMKVFKEFDASKYLP